MKTELTQEEILKEINDHNPDDVIFLVELVDKTTRSWLSVRLVVDKLIELLKENGELSDVLERNSDN